MDNNNNKPVNGISTHTDQYSFWHEQLTASKKALKPWHEQCEMIIKRYLDDRDDQQTGRSKGQRYNLFATNVDILKGALFARIPEPDVSRRFKDPEDQVGRVAGVALQRVLSYELENDNYFTSVAKSCIQDYLLTGLGVGWVRYEFEPSTSLSITDEAEGQAEVPQQPGTPPLADERTPIEHVHWSDFLYTPARTWPEVTWVARRAFMNKAAIKERFGEDAAEEISFKLSRESVVTHDAFKGVHEERPVEHAEIYEIWDKNSKKAYWFSFHFNGMLDEKDDPLGLPHFFPCGKPMFANNENSDLIPVPDWHRCRNLYEELDVTQKRIFSLAKQLSLRGVYNDANGAIKDLINATDNKLVGVPNWSAYQEKGGVQGNMEFMPLEPVMQTIAGLSKHREDVKTAIYEQTGITDIVRGVGQMYSTATESQLKSQYASLRLTEKQQDVADFLTALIGIKAHTICRFYDKQRILSRCGTPAAADMPFVEQAIALLKQADLTHFKLKVSVDSLQNPDWNADKQARSELTMSISQFLSQALPAVERSPELAPLMGKLLIFSTAGFKGAESVEGEVVAAMEKVQQAIQQKAMQPPAPPPPSDAQINADVKKLELQQKDDHAKKQAQLDVEMSKAKAAEDKEKRDQEFELKKLELQRQERQDAAALKLQEMELQIKFEEVHLKKLTMIRDARAAGAAMDMTGIALDPMGDVLGQVVEHGMASITADVNNTDLVTKEDLHNVALTLEQAFNTRLQELADMPVPEQTIKVVRTPDGLVGTIR